MFSGAASLREALRLLRAHRELWAWCALPVLINLMTFALACVAFWHALDPLTETLQAALASEEPAQGIEWLWRGPLNVLAWGVKWVVVLLFGVAIYFGFTLVGGIVASPFLDVLSRRVERIHRGEVIEEGSTGLGDTLRAALRVVLEESRRTLFFLGGGLCFVALGWVPGLQPVALVGAVLFAMLFLPLDYAGYLLDRREIPFRARRRWVWQHRVAMLGFGAACMGTFLLPGVNFLCLPWLVSAATIFTLDLGVPDAGVGLPER